MKKFRKVIASLIVAASMISLTTVTASAADYGVTPSYPAPSNPVVQPSTPSTDEDKTEDKTNEETPAGDSSESDTKDAVVSVGSTEDPVETVTEETVANAIAAVIADENATEVVIHVGEEEATITEAAIGEIAKNDVVVTLKSTNCTVTIDPALITEVKDIDLAMNIFKAEDDVEGVSVPTGALVIAPAQKGDFGMTVTVTVPAETVTALNTDDIFCYYISDDGEVEDLSDAITVNEDGSISVAISHASQYVITDVEIAIEGEAEEEIEIDEEYEVDDDSASDSDASDNVDDNPGTGVALFGSAVLAVVSAAAATATAKKRK